MDIKVYEGIDKTGKAHKIPEGSCVICKHCTDIFLDPWENNKIYAHVCELNKEEEFHNRFSYLDFFCSGYEQCEDLKELKDEEGDI